jgi:FtsZ-binding cell division protein ZapB
MGIPRSRVSEMPRLDAFDEEFGHKPVAVLRGQRRKRLRFSTLIIAALGAAIIAALAWPWAVANGRLYSEVRALLPSLRTASENASGEEQTNRLVRQIDALKTEIAGLTVVRQQWQDRIDTLKTEVAELTEARQQVHDKIASLEAGKQEPAAASSRDHSSSASWYSDLAALNYGIVVDRPSGSINAPPPSRRSATARTEARTDGSSRRKGSAPLPLEPPR